MAAREVSRFARNSRDWQQLIEMCRVVDTVLIEQEAVYAPRQGNDRLLLGLKGSLNEYELDLLRQRSLSARYEKARRGELVVTVPIGFLKAGDRIEKDRAPGRRHSAPPRGRAEGHPEPGRVGWPYYGPPRRRRQWRLVRPRRAVPLRSRHRPAGHRKQCSVARVPPCALAFPRDSSARR
ncbi:recombinase family protein [Sinorhizobium meliloti]|uniref:recombinase family protein n=1 Tax=Rhizobium meliloti TaxID=382 RepID=UPI001F476E3C|nr:recombinase family protein [Sinorhizobium meliloti]